MRALINNKLDVYVETDDAVAPAIDPNFATVFLNQYSKTKTLTDETEPALESEPVDLSTTLIAGVGSIDLTAAPIAYRDTDTVDLTGKRLIAILLFAPVANAGTITVASGAVNGYAFGTLEPGESLSRAQTEQVSTRQAVAAGDKVLDVTGSGTDSVQILAVFGDS